MAAFEPIVSGSPRVLILGSMPSQISLKEHQYYANPRNAFWWIMSTLFEFDLTSEYQLRTAFVVNAGIAVWDVLHDCERPGSLDSSIVKKSEQPNDFKTFLYEHQTLSRVVFNGAKAEAIFLRHNKELIKDLAKSRPDFEWHRCPSTSPAHASITKYDKLAAWRTAIL